MEGRIMKNKIPEIKLNCPGDIESVVRQALFLLAKGESSHDLDHTLRVLHNAETLLDAHPEADADVVRLSALLHDIARPEEDADCGKCCHAELSAVYAETILRDAGVPENITLQTVNAVRRHRFRRGEAPDTPEAKILYDADKLDSLGAVGLGRAFLFAGHCNARLHNTVSEALAAPPYSREDTAYREYLVKLRFVPEKMFTVEGKRIAVERLQFMKEFFLELDAETN
ncbi:MAG: HD domain-containing protein [Lentisphaerae bacterium]|nr:HD domain-containing protein [Lentisphaerota bacterium]